MIYKNPIVIFNPYSNGGKNGKNFESIYKVIKKLLKKDDLELYKITTKDESINRIIKICEDKKNDLIVTVGGDGTVSSVVNILMTFPKENRIPILLLPFGTGNAILRHFGHHHIKKGRDFHSENPVTKFDVLRTVREDGTIYYCLNVVGIGFISDAMKYVVNVESFEKLKYIFGIAKAMKEFKKYILKSTYRDENGEIKTLNLDDVIFITVSNTKYAGGNILLAPSAIHNDGFMNVSIAHSSSRRSFIKGVFSAALNKVIAQKDFFTFKASSIEIELDPKTDIILDGEISPESHIKVDLLPEEIEMIV